MILDLTKPMKTREGNGARFVGELINNTYPLLFAISFDGEEYAETYTREGKIWVSSHIDDPQDIINVIEKKFAYLIFFKYPTGEHCLETVTYDKNQANLILADMLKDKLPDENYFMKEIELD